MKCTKKIRILNIFLTLFLAMIAAITLSVSSYTKEKVEYKISLPKGSKISALYIDDHKKNLKNYRTKKLDYDKDGNYLIARENVDIEMKVSIVSDVSITFSTDEVEIWRDVNKQKIDQYGVYYNKISFFNILKESISCMSIVYFLVFLPIMYICLSCIRCVFLKIKDKNIQIKDIIIYTTSIFIVALFTIYPLLIFFKTVIIVPLVAFILYGLFNIKNVIKDNIEYAYIFLVPILGVMMIFLIPPLNIPDEEAHYIKSYELLDKTSYDDEGEAYLPKEVHEFVTSFKYTSMDYEEKLNGKNYLVLFTDDFDYKDRADEVYSYKNTKYSSFLPYLPSGIVMHIGKLFRVSSLNLLTLGRFVNLLISIVLGYLAIKVTPQFKKIFFIILTLPSVLQHSAAINMDWLTISISILLLAFLIKKINQKNELSKKDFSIFVILGIILGFCKFGYFPVMLLIFLISNRKFSKNKYKSILIKMMLFVIPLAISFIINSGIGATLSGESTSFYTIEYSLKHPLDVVMVYFRTFLNRFDMDLLRGHFDGFGIYTKWNSSIFTMLLTILYSIIILLYDKNDRKLSVKERVFYIIPACLIIGIVYTAMFLGWTNMGLEAIEGLQPRYFIVANILLFIALSNDKFVFKAKNNNYVYSLFVVLVYLISFITILYGFY